MEELLLKYILQSTSAISFTVLFLIYIIRRLILYFQGESNFVPFLKTSAFLGIVIGLFFSTSILISNLIPDLRGYLDIQQNQTETVSGRVSEIRGKSNRASIIVIDGEEYIYFKHMDFQVYEKMSYTVVYGEDSRYVIDMKINPPD